MELQENQDLIEVNQLIDLTDKPIGLTRDEISWSRVRSSASNCLCCCCNNSITLVTTDNSYILNHVPLDNIQHAQTNATLQYLALSNHRKLVVVDLVDTKDICKNSSNTSKLTNEIKNINLAAHGLTMNDIVFWCWIDDDVLAILSYEALYTCTVDQQQINHPAHSALSTVSRNITLDKVFDCHPHLNSFCQVTQIQRNSTATLYAISSLYSSNNLYNLGLSIAQQFGTSAQKATTHHLNPSQTLKPSFGSVPSRLSQLAHGDNHSIDSLKSEHLFETHHQIPIHTENIINGLVQIYCKNRNRSQLIQAQAVTYTSIPTANLSPKKERKLEEPSSSQKTEESVILIAANKSGNQMRVHFIEMATNDLLSFSGLNASPTINFNQLTEIDFPTSIVCSQIDSSDRNYLHVALITTKYGQLFICSVTHCSILFSVSIATDIISSTVLETNTRGLMVICKNGPVLLVKLNSQKLVKLIDERKTLRHISSTHSMLSSYCSTKDLEKDITDSTTKVDMYKNMVEKSDSGMGPEVLMSTRL